MGQDRGFMSGHSISPIPGNECVLLCPLLCWVLQYGPRTKSLDPRTSWNGGFQFGAISEEVNVPEVKKLINQSDTLRVPERCQHNLPCEVRHFVFFRYGLAEMLPRH
ncbi:hypothetical protein AVEN_97426-1 [Araneus ventricosus]|uniref:Uncharacterized protein n=1 Tax=Araneus ventricosus TaxID=182803 RepID=A0A4Y2EKS3_ARAVE|nr:hypothetical protein AVEN_97426-1 [Araneus ventricosus]